MVLLLFTVLAQICLRSDMQTPLHLVVFSFLPLLLSSCNSSFLSIVLPFLPPPQDDELRETIEESQQLYDLYSHYFDLTIVNEDFDETYKKIKNSIQTLSTDTQWVPVNWVY